ncbi:MAG: hypothetical protein KC478_10205, partial [Bacteriovoracaceae bacterium]|nr:hypothetical protein [Bacteriovoracaceae bacterium]
MKTLRLFRVTCVFLLSVSCSLSPFSANNSARTLGVGSAAAELGNANSNYFIRTSMGLSENFDLGYVMEFGSDFSTSGMFGKYAFINNETGPSVAMEGGYGSTEASSHYYLGAIGSIAFSESFEVFIN